MSDEMMRLVPLHDKILVRPRRKKVLVKSGLVIPETAQSYARPEEGWVVAVNEGRDNRQPVVDASVKLVNELSKIPRDGREFDQNQVIEGLLTALSAIGSFLPETTEASPFKEGELVYFTKHVGMSVQIEGQTFLIIGEDQIIGKIALEKLTEDERGEFERGDQDESGSGENASGSGDASGSTEGGKSDRVSESAGNGENETDTASVPAEHQGSGQELSVPRAEDGIATAGEVHRDSDVGQAVRGSDYVERSGQPGEVDCVDKD